MKVDKDWGQCGRSYLKHIALEIEDLRALADITRFINNNPTGIPPEGIRRWIDALTRCSCHIARDKCEGIQEALKPEGEETHEI